MQNVEVRVSAAECGRYLVKTLAVFLPTKLTAVDQEEATARRFRALSSARSSRAASIVLRHSAEPQAHVHEILLTRAGLQDRMKRADDRPDAGDRRGEAARRDEDDSPVVTILRTPSHDELREISHITRDDHPSIQRRRAQDLFV